MTSKVPSSSVIITIIIIISQEILIILEVHGFDNQVFGLLELKILSTSGWNTSQLIGRDKASVCSLWLAQSEYNSNSYNIQGSVGGLGAATV